MTRSQMIETVARKTGFTEAQVETTMDALFDQIADCLRADEKVTIAGFGRFEMRPRKPKAYTNPKRLHRVHSHFFMIVLGMTEGGFLLPELLAAFAVDVRRRGRSVARRCIVHHLLHSTTKAHSAAHKISAVIEIHAHR